jgi:type IV pilus assembly protein PilX
MRLTLQNTSSKSQSGAVLVTGLLILVMLTLIGVTAMSTNLMDERMAGNSRDWDLAFQATESALRDGELDIQKNISPASGFTATCTNGLCLPPATSFPWYTTIDWSSASVTRAYGQYTSATALPYVSTKPKYIIENIGKPATQAGGTLTIGIKPNASGTAFRVSSRGVGGRSETHVIAQSIYVKR